VNKGLSILKLLVISLILISCDLEIEVSDISSILAPSNNIISVVEFNFDENYVEQKNGNLQLKPLDLEHYGVDFSKGTHGGTYPSDGLSFLYDKNSNQLKVTEILPSQADKLISYLRFDNNFNQEIPAIAPTLVGDLSFNSNAKVGSYALTSSVHPSNRLIIDGFDVGTSSFTASIWVKPTGFEDWQRVLSEETANPNFDWQIKELSSDGDYHFLIHMNNGSNCISNSDVGGVAKLPLGTWSHLVARYDSIANQISFFQNGVQ